MMILCFYLPWEKVPRNICTSDICVLSTQGGGIARPSSFIVAYFRQTDLIEAPNCITHNITIVVRLSCQLALPMSTSDQCAMVVLRQLMCRISLKSRIDTDT